MTKTIHWLGAGLSSTPGIKRLADGQNPLIVWNRTLAKAQNSLAEIQDKIQIRQLDWQELKNTVNAGDVLVSMLPATNHLNVAELCLQTNAHFVSSSYISPQMAALNQQATTQGLCFVNEVGLDPGIDHLLAHALVDQYQQSPQFSADNEIYFRSYCGGFPKIANDFKYKFSWSPLGVLKALKSPAKWLDQGETKTCQAPWHALTEHSITLLDSTETFQAYPNRDSLPFLQQYGFDKNWQVKQFVRGTLRLAGWSTAWQYLFDEVASISSEDISAEDAEQKLKKISQNLEEKYSYDIDEPDRVVLSVELVAKQGNKTIWHNSYLLDACGNKNGQAMARLVSLPVSLAVEAILDQSIDKGVSAAPHQPEQVNTWLTKLESLGEKVTLRDHLA
ncbi:MAG: saccharopine dehydrogenase NADP-binding domain-containing protein [Alteromonadaceae bacterium]|nr:saccharopine dehydrogenase NADP-binding domain-containing protein [Alteromonadaceae bacterium]